MKALVRAQPALTAAAAFATVCAALALVPLFDSGRWVVPVLLITAVMALTGAVSRAVRLPAPLQPLVQLAVLATCLTVTFARPAAAFGFLPGPVALGELQRIARAALTQADAALAPVPTTTLMLFLAVAGIGIVALIVDVIAVTLRLPGFAGFPLLLVYAMPAAVVAGGVPWWLLPISALGWLVLLAVEQRVHLRAWGPLLATRPLASRARPGASAHPRGPRLRPTGGGLPAVQAGLVAVIAALIVAALAPGLGEPVYVSSTGIGVGGAGTVTVDPFASLRRDLVDNPQREVLRYTTDSAATGYLRMASLDTFDGETWRASPNPLPLPITETLGVPEAPAVADVRETAYDVRVTGLDNPFLPVPYAASRLEGIDAELDPRWAWDPTARTVSAPGLSSAGTDYRVTSYQVDPTRAELRAASGSIDPALEPYLALPDGLTPDLARLAREATADARAPYAQAEALVRWFTRDGGFTYSTSVTTPDGADPLQSFLDERVGYCQQFAGTMALMARAVGIPSRVIVGFTSGRQEGGEYVVYARNAHAWPELWLDGVGWVRFEPTPRADAAGGVAQPDYAQPREEAPAPTPGPEASAGPDRRIPPEERAGLGAIAAAPDAASPARAWWLLPLIALIAVLACLPSAVVAWRRRRRTSSRDGATRVEGAWADLADSARDLGWSWPLSATPRNAARLLDAQVRLDDEERDLLSGLVRAVERARYASDADGAPSGADLRSAIGRIRHAAQRTTGWRGRLRAFLMPASLRRHAVLTAETAEEMSQPAGR